MYRAFADSELLGCLADRGVVFDDEVDENGNPLPDEDTEAPANDEAGQVPIEASVVSEEDTADETGDDNETKTK